jgi:hypothetical protein
MKKVGKIMVGAAAAVAAAAGASILLHKSPVKRDIAPSLYRGSHTSKTLHKTGCRFYDSVKLTRVFNDLPEAVHAGYRPCRICLP